MNIEGASTLQATPELIWQCMMDKQILLQTIPGIEHIEQLDESTYTFTTQLQQLPLNGSYQVQMTISEPDYPHCFHLTLESKGKQTTLQSTGTISLYRQGKKTVVDYKGTVTLGKAAALFRPSVQRGAIKLLLQQFFTALAQQVSKKGEELTLKAEQQKQREEQRRREATTKSVVVATERAAVKVNKAQTIPEQVIQISRRGTDKPKQVVSWKKRVQRVTTISGLLALVWVGTRLPSLWPGSKD